MIDVGEVSKPQLHGFSIRRGISHAQQSDRHPCSDSGPQALPSHGFLSPRGSGIICTQLAEKEGEMETAPTSKKTKNKSTTTTKTNTMLTPRRHVASTHILLVRTRHRGPQ